MPQGDDVATARAFYEASVERYVDFAGTGVSAATEGPIDRSLLTAFVELLGAGPGRRVADIGCGPGRVAAFLAAHGLDVVGIDASPSMLAVARRAHAGIRFEVGLIDDLPLADGSLDGAVCWYSVIHTAPEHLDDVFAELARVLSPRGHLLVAFQSGSGEGVHRADAHGTTLPLTSYRHDPGDVARRLEAAGFEIRATTVREAELEHESTPQGFVLARSR